MRESFKYKAIFLLIIFSFYNLVVAIPHIHHKHKVEILVSKVSHYHNYRSTNNQYCYNFQHENIIQETSSLTHKAYDIFIELTQDYTHNSKDCAESSSKHNKHKILLVDAEKTVKNINCITTNNINIAFVVEKQNQELYFRTRFYNLKVIHYSTISRRGPPLLRISPTAIA